MLEILTAYKDIQSYRSYS